MGACGRAGGRASGRACLSVSVWMGGLVFPADLLQEAVGGGGGRRRRRDGGLGHRLLPVLGGRRDAGRRHLAARDGRGRWRAPDGGRGGARVEMVACGRTDGWESRQVDVCMWAGGGFCVRGDEWFTLSRPPSATPQQRLDSHAAGIPIAFRAPRRPRGAPRGGAARWCARALFCARGP